MNQATTDRWVVDVGIPVIGDAWRVAFFFGDELENDVKRMGGEVESAGIGFGTRDIQFIFDSEDDAALAYDFIRTKMKREGYDPDQGATEENLGEMTCYISIYNDVEQEVEES